MGGEVSGTIDESIRHAVTKFAHIHFPASQEAKERIIKLGDNYIEIFVKASLKELVRRDTKGLYKKALNGELENLIGVDPDTPYQLPTKPDLVIDTDNENEDQSFKKILTLLSEKK